MARRKRVASDDDRLRLMWEAVEILSSRRLHRLVLGDRCVDTDGSRALMAVIERELTPAELDIVRRRVAAEERARVLDALLPHLPHDEEGSFTLRDLAGVRWSGKGWVIRDTEGVVDLQERRTKRKAIPANPAPKG